MNYFKDNNNKVFAYDDEQVAQGYGKDLISLPIGEYYDGVSTTARPYKLDDTWVEIIKDEEGTIVSPQGLVEQLANEEAERLASEVKVDKVKALDTLAVEINGVTYDAHQEAINNMSAVTNVAHTKYNQLITSGMGASMAYDSVYKQVVPWKGADNEVHTVQVESLVEALEAAMTERAKIYQAM